jgi:dTDP-4-dehydrorhamnose reductase
MHVLITGAGGFLGSAVAAEVARQGWVATALYRQHLPRAWPQQRAQQVDTTDLAALQSAVLEVFPDVIINCAAVPQGAFVEADPDLATKLNVALPAELARLANHLGARLIHLSTEQVFDGQEAPYAPTDTPLPLHLYGQQKLLAEREVLAAARKSSVVLRLPLLTGNSPGGHRAPHEALLHDLAEGKLSPQWTDVVRQPASTANVARLIGELILRPNLNGLFHWAGTEPVTRAELSQRTWARFSDQPFPWPTEPCPHPRVPRDLRLASPNLLGKVKCRPEDLDTQLAALQLPTALVGHPVLAEHGVQRPALPRLRKGIDF